MTPPTIIIRSRFVRLADFCHIVGFTIAGIATSTLAAHNTAADSPVHPDSVLGHTLDRINGEPQNLEDFKGKVVLIVNVASRCGYTPQYTALQMIYEKYEQQGFVVLGFPANNFGGQEPATNKDIAAFCESKFGVTFPMFAKVSVKGEDKAPLYGQLTELPEPIGGEIKWNFTKFLVDRRGHAVARFEPRTTPDDVQITSAIERLLAETAPERPE